MKENGERICEKHLEETNHTASLQVHVNVIESRAGWKSRNGHDVTTNGVDVTSTNCSTDISDKYGETSRDALSGGVCAQRVLGLGHADGQVAVSRGRVSLIELDIQ